jgi:hypothetical protein
VVAVPGRPRGGGKGKLTAVLDHQLRIGDAQLSETIIAAYKERGLQPPEHIEKPPQIEGRFLVYWEAYQDLQTERVHPRGRIPIGAITDYALNAGVDVDTLKRIVWRVDNVLLEHWAGLDKNAAAQQKSRAALGATL